MKELVEAIRLNIKNGDIIFVDQNAVDTYAMREHPFFNSKDRPTDFIVIPVAVPKGKTLLDCIVVANETTQEKTQ